MTNINSNIEELKKILNEPNFKLDEAIEFLEAIEENATELNDEITRLEEVVDEKDNEISSLGNPDDFEVSCDSTIECGIGQINYENPNNLLLQDLMENLESGIKSKGSKHVSEVLASI